MSFFLNGIHVPHRKNTYKQTVTKMTTVNSVTIPTQMHIGSPAQITVKIGDEVKIGSLIADATGKFSSPIYASISGKVKKIADIVISNGSTVPAVTIESDGEMSVSDNIQAPTVNNREELIEAICNSGVVGLGGAGFPTHVKFDVDPCRIEELILNGAECEPYITSDTYTMTQRADDMEFALNALKKHMGIKNIIVGVENNNKASINAMNELAKRINGMRVAVLPAYYPQGGEKVLVYHTTKKVIPTGKLPIDVGSIVCNVTTVAAIGHYLKTGMPLVEKCVTVDGGAVKSPQNVIAPIGTSVGDVFDFCGGLTADPEKVIYGGPMMGLTVPDMTAPIIKNTNAVLALTAKEVKLPKTTACIRCGACTNNCPFGLAAAEFLLAYNKKDAEQLEKLSINTCMECGCCSFICPANRPLVQTNKLAKAFVKEQKAKEASQNG